ncbi:GNAT family N-acetyltransferase [Streptomyces sp. NPDC003691]
MSADVQNFAVAHLRRRPEVAEVAGFVVGFDPGTASPYVNYATPLPGSRPADGDIAALVAAFRGRGLVPRLEFAPEAAPAVAPALRRAGFGVEETQEYLVCAAGGLVVPEGPAAGAPETDGEYEGVAAALAAAFGGEPFPGGPAGLRRTRETGGAVRCVPASAVPSVSGPVSGPVSVSVSGSASGSVAVSVSVSGGGAGTAAGAGAVPDAVGPGRAGGAGVPECAGAGVCSPVAGGTAELAGIGTRPEYRGRGVAAAVTAALTLAAFEAGAASAWLESSGDGSRRVYERLGYRAAGTRLYMVLADPA